MRTISKTKNETLECGLTQDEFVERATALAAVCLDIESEGGRQSLIKADMKAQLARLEAEQSRLTLVVTRRAEPREVPVTVYADDDHGVAVTIREDTGEIVRQRDLEPTERQLSLPDVGA
jgi:hypothetical protein